MKWFKSTVQFIIILSIPLLLVTTAIRLVLSPVFINLEYRMPGFPKDPYGFSTEDRLYWAQYSIDYLSGKISHDEFSGQVLPSGDPLFNHRELTHMLDVRMLTAQVLQVWWLILFLSVIILMLALRFRFSLEWLQAVKSGSILTISLILSILLYVALDFNRLFTQFHLIFFEGDSWLFLLTDNLIRLFPLRFWQDLFIFIGAANLISAFLLYFLSKKIQGKIKT